MTQVKPTGARWGRRWMRWWKSYYQNQPHAVVGRLVGLSEQAARRRALRALEKLRGMLDRRGIVTSSAALALMLPVHAVTPAAADLARGIVQASVAAWVPSAPASFLTPLFAMTATSKTVLSASVLVLLIAAVAWRNSARDFRGSVGTVSPGRSATAENEARLPGVAPRSRSGTPEAEQVAKVRGWLAANTEITRGDLKREMLAVAKGLSLAGLEELLSDPVVLGYFDDPDLDKAQGPMKARFLFCDRLWSRYAALAPEAALARALPGGRIVEKDRMAWKAVLMNASQSLPERVYELWTLNCSEDDPRMASKDAFGTIMRNWAAKDPQRVLAEIPKLPPHLAQRAYSGYAFSLGPGTDWNAEARRLLELFPAAPGRQGLADSLGRKWVMSDPDAAFAWVASLHLDDRLTPIAMMTDWMKEEPLKAAAWLRSHEPTGVPRPEPAAQAEGRLDPQSAGRDDFMTFLLNQVTGDVSAAAAATGLIEDQAARDKAVMTAARSFVESREVMLMWENSALLSPATRETVAAMRKKLDEIGQW